MVIERGDIRNLSGVHPKLHEVRDEPLSTRKEISDVQSDVFNQFLRALEQMEEGRQRQHEGRSWGSSERLRKSMPSYELKRQQPEKLARKKMTVQETEKRSQNQASRYIDTEADRTETASAPESTSCVSEVGAFGFSGLSPLIDPSSRSHVRSLVGGGRQHSLEEATDTILEEHLPAYTRGRGLSHTSRMGAGQVYALSQEVGRASEHYADDILKNVTFERVSAPVNYQETEISSVDRMVHMLHKEEGAEKGTAISIENSTPPDKSAVDAQNNTGALPTSQAAAASGAVPITAMELRTEEKPHRGPITQTLSTTLSAAGSSGQSQGGAPIGKVQLPRQAISQAERVQAMMDMGEKFKALLQRGETHMKIHLTPQSLGKIEVRLDINRLGQAQAFFMADYRDTMSLLAQYTHEMEKIFQESGLQADRSDFNYGNHEDSPGGDRQEDPTEQQLKNTSELLARDVEGLPEGKHATVVTTQTSEARAINIEV